MIHVEFKGTDKVREKLPRLAGRKIAAIPILMLTVLFLSLGVMVFIELLPRLLPDIALLAAIEPFLVFIISTCIAAVGLYLVTSLWRKKEEMQKRFGDLAYQKMLPRGATGVFMMMSLIVHAFVSVRSLPPVPPVNDLTIAFSRSLLPYLGVPLELDIAIRLLIGIPFFILGFLSMRRSILTFGIDYMLVVYLYFPEESEIKENDIYSVLRHPTYFGGILLAAGAFTLRFSVYSFFFLILVYLVLKGLSRVEEKELVERFGEGYSDYMTKVPGLCVRPRDFGRYLKFLRGDNENKS